jgi:hypothetical protein
MTSNSDQISKQQRNAIKSARKQLKHSATMETVKQLNKVKTVQRSR